MANQETKQLDSIIASRRALLVGGGAALAALAMPKTAKAANNVTTFTDFDILNFALNLEYLEANFYYMAAFGCTIDNVVVNGVTNSYAAAAGITSNLSIASSSGTAGVTATTTGATQVPFTIPAVKAYAIETAIEEGKHVAFLQNAIKSFGGTSVAQPSINISPAVFTTLAVAAGVGSPFLVGGTYNPYANDVAFLGGAFIFEDVGVTAYAGAAPYVTRDTNYSTVLQAAASILAVEAYHAGLIRSTIYLNDVSGANGYLAGTQKIAQFRANGAHATGAAPTSTPAFPLPGSSFPDDYGLYAGTYPVTGTTNPPATTTTVSIGATTGVASNIADADPTNVVGYSRTTSQVLNIVTANQNGAGPTVGSPAKGGFFPNGLNGTFV